MTCKPKHKTLRAALGFDMPGHDPFSFGAMQTAQNNAASRFANSSYGWAVDDRNRLQQNNLFDQGLKSSQFGLQRDQFGLQRDQFGLQQNQQNFNQGLHTKQFGLQQNQQNFNQGLQRDQFGLQKDQQTFNQGLQRDQFGLQLQDRALATQNAAQDRVNTQRAGDLAAHVAAQDRYRTQTLQDQDRARARNMGDIQFGLALQNNALDNQYRGLREQRNAADFNRAQAAMSRPRPAMTPYRFGLRNGGEIHAANGFVPGGFAEQANNVQWMSPRDKLDYQSKMALADVDLELKRAQLAQAAGGPQWRAEVQKGSYGLRMAAGGEIHAAMGYNYAVPDDPERIPGWIDTFNAKGQGQYVGRDKAKANEYAVAKRNAETTDMMANGGAYPGAVSLDAARNPYKRVADLENMYDDSGYNPYTGIYNEQKKGAGAQWLAMSKYRMKDGGSLRTGMGGDVPGTGKGDKIDAKYEPGEFVVSNDMLDAEPELRDHLRTLREQVLADKGMTVAEADAKAVGGGKGLRADVGWARPNPVEYMAAQNSEPIDSVKLPTAEEAQARYDAARESLRAAEGPSFLSLMPAQSEDRQRIARAEANAAAAALASGKFRSSAAPASTAEKPAPAAVAKADAATVAAAEKAKAALANAVGDEDPFSPMSQAQLSHRAVSLGDRLESDQLTNTVMSRGLRRAGEPTNTDINLQRLNSDPAARDTYNAALKLRGAGIQVLPGGEGHGPIFTNSTGPEKMKYLDANNNPTNDWSQTKDYRESIGRTQKIQALGDKLEGERNRRELQQQEAAMTDAAMNGDNRAAALLPGLRSLRGEMMKNDTLVRTEADKNAAHLEGIRLQNQGALEQLGAKRDVSRGMEQLISSAVKQAGGNPEQAVNLLSQNGFGDAAGTLSKRATADNDRRTKDYENMLKEFKGMVRTPDGNEIPGGAELAADELMKIVKAKNAERVAAGKPPIGNILDADGRAEMMKEATLRARAISGMRAKQSLRDSSIWPWAGLEGAPSGIVPSAKPERVGFWNGLATGGDVARGDYEYGKYYLPQGVGQDVIDYLKGTAIKHAEGNK